MSNRTYNGLWIDTQKDLQAVLSEEHFLSTSKSERDREIAFKSVSKLYLKYVAIFRNLDTCYDQIVHPQKRILLRQLLDATIGRILELKHELVNLDSLEYSFHDESLGELGLGPGQAELVVPRFVLRDREEQIKYWQEQLKAAMGKLELAEVETTPEAAMSVEEAVLLLQRHERARQGRLRAKLMREIRRQEAAAAEKASKALRGAAEETLSTAMAASKIQSIWKGALARRMVRRQREVELAFIGMIPPTEFPHSYQDRLADIEKERRLTQAKHAKDYEEALTSLKNELKVKEGEGIEEEMKEDIREWFFRNRDDQGRFPDYPSDDEGGSAAIFHPELFVAPPAAAAAAGTTPSSPKAGGGAGRAAAKKKRGDGEGAPTTEESNVPPQEKLIVDKKSKEIDDDEGGFVLKTSNFVKLLKSGHRTFNELWVRKKGIQWEGSVPQQQRAGMSLMEMNDRCFATFETWKDKNESLNKIQSFDKEMVLNSKRSEVEEEIRLRVDALMREELDILKIASERDKGKKGKITKKRKKGKKKAGKKGKKKKDKDLTPDRTTESLFEELVVNGIITTVPEVPLLSFLGEMNFVGSILKKNEGKDPNPGAGDIRRAIAEYCILPMSSSYLRENAPNVKSLLLVGPEGTGKTMLLHAVCTELGATLFDLTASNIVGKYPGKSGLNMLLHLVMKVSKLLQPSVIFIDQAEKTFLKKVSKTDKTDPKRLKKDLPRLVRSLSSEDRVMLIGASRCPWECEQKGLTQTYQKMLMLPRPDYGHRYSLWKELITERGGRILRWSDKFDLSALTKVSDGYTAGHIAEVTLSERRLMQQGVKPLQPTEFIAALAKNEPVYREEEEAYSIWYGKSVMGKKRSKYVEGDDDEAKKEKKKFARKKK